MDLFQNFIQTRNAYIKCQIIIFNTQNASHKSDRNEGNVHDIAYGDPHGRNVNQKPASVDLLCACLNLRPANAKS